MALTERQAYDAMFLFVLDFWNRDKGQSDLVDLLSFLDRGVWGDAGSNDPAMEEDWRRCVERITEGFDPYAAFR
jgi:hypothetical protein